MTAAVLLGFWESAVKTAGKVISLKKPVKGKLLAHVYLLKL